MLSDLSVLPLTASVWNPKISHFFTKKCRRDVSCTHPLFLDSALDVSPWVSALGLR